MTAVVVADRSVDSGVFDRFAHDVRAAFPGATRVEFDRLSIGGRPRVVWVMAGSTVLSSSFRAWWDAAPGRVRPDRALAGIDGRLAEALGGEHCDGSFFGSVDVAG